MVPRDSCLFIAASCLYIAAAVDDSVASSLSKLQVQWLAIGFSVDGCLGGLEHFLEVVRRRTITRYSGVYIYIFIAQLDERYVGLAPVTLGARPGYD